MHHPNPEGQGLFAAGFVDVLRRWRAGAPLPHLDEVIPVAPIPVRSPGRNPPKKGGARATKHHPVAE